VVENYLLNPELDACSFRDEIDENFLNTLLTGVALDMPKIDSEITEFLRDGWTIEKIEDVSRQILRFGTFELKFMHDIPAKVVLDQYVDIAASFFDSGKITFINATLDAVAKKFRGEEFLSK
jgi:N utilization substance protein B